MLFLGLSVPGEVPRCSASVLVLLAGFLNSASMARFVTVSSVSDEYSSRHLFQKTSLSSTHLQPRCIGCKMVLPSSTYQMFNYVSIPILLRLSSNLTSKRFITSFAVTHVLLNPIGPPSSCWFGLPSNE